MTSPGEFENFSQFIGASLNPTAISTLNQPFHTLPVR